MDTRILLADDHELFSSGLLALLRSEPDLEVIGEARDGREACLKARELEPDLVLMDLAMPGLNGIEATQRIVNDSKVKVLCLSMHAEARFVKAALRSGASGYLLKDSKPKELIRAIREVAAGGTYISPSVAGTVVEMLRDPQPGAGSSAFAVLTEREREVLQLLAEGRSTREIASELFLSPKTVGTHREHLMEKLQIHSIAGLTKYAVREGLTSIEPDDEPES